MADESRPALRARLRSARRAIGPADRHAAAVAADSALARLGLPRPHTRIAAYQAMDGEIDPSVVLHRALALGCELHFPIITSVRNPRMYFAPLTDAGEPAPAAKACAARWLELVLVPLVGFDHHGNRLGMGAGFYDRQFAFLRHRKAWRRPLLVGLAFEVQRLESLPPMAHDVPLWGIVTECAVYGQAGART
jgi:5-formyltetrahydrofolate cyclo-ligase